MVFGEHWALVRSDVAAPGIDQRRRSFLHDVIDGERHAGVQHVHEDVDLLDVDPLPRDGGGDVGLVLMVGEIRSIFQPLAESPESSIAIWAASVERRAEVGIETRIIGEYADLDVLVLPRRRSRRMPARCRERERKFSASYFSLNFACSNADQTPR
jgi:hypothetical protein